MCFQEWIVEDAGKSAKIRGNFQMLISQAKRKLFRSFQSLEGHVAISKKQSDYIEIEPLCRSTSQVTGDR